MEDKNKDNKKGYLQLIEHCKRRTTAYHLVAATFFVLSYLALDLTFLPTWNLEYD